MDLLFELATWHALGKLRLHTESTIVDLEHSTQRLGKAIRNFDTNLCSEYVAGELPGDDAPRGKRKRGKKAREVTDPEITAGGASCAKRKGKAREADSGVADPNKQPGSTKLTAKSKVYHLNLSTYKLHALGHYAEAIRRFGPSDGYSTQGVRIQVISRNTIHSI